MSSTRPAAAAAPIASTSRSPSPRYVSTSSSTNSWSPPVISSRFANAASSIASDMSGNLGDGLVGGRDEATGRVYAVDAHRPAEALELALAGRLGVDRAVDRRVRPLGNEDLARYRLAAQPRGEDDRVADAAVVVAALEPDPAHRRVSSREPDPDLEDVAAPSPLLADLPEALADRDRQPDRASRVVVLELGVVEEHHDPVAGEVLERSLVLDHQRPDRRVVAPQEPQHLLGLGALRERREVAQVAEHRGDLAAMAREQRLAFRARHELGDLRREET